MICGMLCVLQHGWHVVCCVCCRLSELGSGTMLQMMLIDNLIHSDLHPVSTQQHEQPQYKIYTVYCLVQGYELHA